MYSGWMWILEDDNCFLHQCVRTVAKSSSCMGMLYNGIGSCQANTEYSNCTLFWLIILHH